MKHHKKTWSIDDALKEYIQKMLPSIVGIKIDVVSIVGQWKLSQNQPEQNQQGVVEGLSQDRNEDLTSNSQKIAELVREYMLKV